MTLQEMTQDLVNSKEQMINILKDQLEMSKQLASNLITENALLKNQIDSLRRQIDAYELIKEFENDTGFKDIKFGECNPSDQKWIKTDPIAVETKV